MSQSMIRNLIVLMFAGASCSLASVQIVVAGNPIPVDADEVCDTICEPPRPSCCCSLKRKLQLHCIYARRACCCRYIALPYTEPSSIMYYAPGMNGGGYDAACPPAGGPNVPTYSMSTYMFGGAPPTAAAPRSASVR
jgi:hypothetical protein